MQVEWDGIDPEHIPVNIRVNQAEWDGIDPDIYQ